jgi:hypothetical protein
MLSNFVTQDIPLAVHNYATTQEIPRCCRIPNCITAIIKTALRPHPESVKTTSLATPFNRVLHEKRTVAELIEISSVPPLLEV